MRLPRSTRNDNPFLSLRGTPVPKQSPWGRGDRRAESTLSNRQILRLRFRMTKKGSPMTRESGAKRSNHRRNRGKALTRRGDVIYIIRQLKVRRRVCKVPGLEGTVTTRHCGGGVHPRLALDSPSVIATHDSAEAVPFLCRCEADKVSRSNLAGDTRLPRLGGTDNRNEVCALTRDPWR